MKAHPLDPEIRKIWKTYPLRISGHSLSKCCSETTILVQSMEGGFVTRNCPKCGNKETLPEQAFKNELDLWVACPDCKRRMESTILGNNYGFVCESCQVSIQLSDLLPRWEDL